jgi:hypothetical protein
MRANVGEFFLRESFYLVEYSIFHANLANVMEERTASEFFQFLASQSHAAAQNHGIFGDALGMAPRVDVFGF